MKAIPKRIFQMLGLKNLTGLAKMKIPAKRRATKTPKNTSLIIIFGQQDTSTMYMIPRQNPNRRDSMIKSIEFRIELLVEI